LMDSHPSNDLAVFFTSSDLGFTARFINIDCVETIPFDALKVIAVTILFCWKIEPNR